MSLALPCTAKSESGVMFCYRDLISIERIDNIIASTELPPLSLRMARKQPPVTRDKYTYANGNIDRGAVVYQYQQGATIILPQLHLAVESLSQFCRAMEQVFSAHVQTNIYLTPPKNQGFNTHYDDHDVFVLQVSGEKQWRLYEKPIENPYRGEGFKPGEHEIGEPKQEFALKAGDCLYVPRGLLHEAVSESDEASLHTTVGLLVKNWADLMLEAVSEAALRNPKFRHSLPPGFTLDSFNKTEAQQYFNSLIEDFSRDADFTEVFKLFKENFIRERGPDLDGNLVTTSQPIRADQQFRKRRYTQPLLRYDDEEAVLVCGGGNIQFDIKYVPGLQHVLTADAFSTELFKDLSKTDTDECIRKLLAFGVIEEFSTD